MIEVVNRVGETLVPKQSLNVAHVAGVLQQLDRSRTTKVVRTDARIHAQADKQVLEALGIAHTLTALTRRQVGDVRNVRQTPIATSKDRL